MKKKTFFFLWLLLISAFFFLLSKTPVLAFPGQCCNVSADCNNYPSETCTGSFSLTCSTQGYTNPNNTCVTGIAVSTPTPTLPVGVSCCTNDSHCPPGLVCNGWHGDCQLDPQGRTNYCVVPTPTPTLPPGVTPTPTVGPPFVCCISDSDCKTQIGPDWECQTFTMFCVGEGYNQHPNTCSRILVTPTPGGGCQGPCWDKTDCASGCVCVGASPGVQQGTCQIPTKKLEIHCEVDGDPKGGVDTAIGCVPIKTANAFIKWFLGRAILIAGGIAFLMMIAGAFLVIVSSGNPEKVKAGSQLITSAIAGLVFIIFSLFLLRLIGIEILQIPGL